MVAKPLKIDFPAGFTLAPSWIRTNMPGSLRTPVALEEINAFRQTTTTQRSNTGGRSGFQSSDDKASRSGKELVSVRIDRDVLEHFQEEGPGWQDRINEALRKAAGK